MSRALEALYAGDREKARELLPPEGEMSVFEAAAFGRVARLEALLRADPSQATGLSEDGFTALHLAVFGEEEGAARTLLEHGADVNALATSGIAQVARRSAPRRSSAPCRSRACSSTPARTSTGPAKMGSRRSTAPPSPATRRSPGCCSTAARNPCLASDDGRRPADLAQDDGVRGLLSR